MKTKFTLFTWNGNKIAMKLKYKQYSLLIYNKTPTTQQLLIPYNQNLNNNVQEELFGIFNYLTSKQ